MENKFKKQFGKNLTGFHKKKFNKTKKFKPQFKKAIWDKVNQIQLKNYYLW